MEMDRTTIILLCIGFIIVWVVFQISCQKPQQRTDANGVAAQELPTGPGPA